MIMPITIHSSWVVSSAFSKLSTVSAADIIHQQLSVQMMGPVRVQVCLLCRMTDGQSVDTDGRNSKLYNTDSPHHLDHFVFKMILHQYGMFTPLNTVKVIYNRCIVYLVAKCSLGD